MAFTVETLLQIVILILALRALHMVSAGDSCSDVRRSFKAIGPLRIAPYKPVEGKDLRICPNGVTTCCTRKMEESFESAVERNVADILKVKTSSLKFNFGSFAVKFQDDVIDTLSIASNLTRGALKQSLRRKKVGSNRVASILQEVDEMFSSIGLKSSGSGAEKTIQKFVNRIYLLLLDKEYNAAQPDLAFEACVAKETSHLHSNISAKNLMTAMELARTFHKGLAAGAEAVNATESARLSAQCRTELVKMQYCSHCWGLTLIMPCQGVCKNVLGRCLSGVSQLDQYWSYYVASLVAITTNMRSTDPRYNLEIALEDFRNNLSLTLEKILKNTTDLRIVLKERCHSSRTPKRISRSADPGTENKPFDMETKSDQGRKRQNKAGKRHHRVRRKHGRRGLRQFQSLRSMEEVETLESSNVEKSRPIRRPPHKVLTQTPEKQWKMLQESDDKSIESKTPRSQFHNRIERFVFLLNSNVNFYQNLPDSMCTPKGTGIRVSDEPSCWGGEKIIQQNKSKVFPAGYERLPKAAVINVDKEIMNAIESLRLTTKTLFTASGQKTIPDLLLNTRVYGIKEVDLEGFPMGENPCDDEDECEDKGSGKDNFYPDSSFKPRGEHRSGCKWKGKNCKKRQKTSRNKYPWITVTTTPGNSSSVIFNLMTSCLLLILNGLFFTQLVPI